MDNRELLKQAVSGKLIKQAAGWSDPVDAMGYGALRQAFQGGENMAEGAMHAQRGVSDLSEGQFIPGIGNIAYGMGQGLVGGVQTMASPILGPARGAAATIGNLTGVEDLRRLSLDNTSSNRGMLQTPQAPPQAMSKAAGLQAKVSELLQKRAVSYADKLPYLAKKEKGFLPRYKQLLSGSRRDALAALADKHRGRGSFHFRDKFHKAYKEGAKVFGTRVGTGAAVGTVGGLGYAGAKKLKDKLTSKKDKK